MAPLVLNLSFERFDSELATDRDLWSTVWEYLNSNGGHFTIVLTDTALYDVTAVVFSRDTVRALASRYGIDERQVSDEWDLFWQVVDEYLSRTSFDGYIYVPPEVARLDGADFGVVLFFRRLRD